MTKKRRSTAKKRPVKKRLHPALVSNQLDDRNNAEEESCDDLEEEDVDFFQDPARSFSFLHRLTEGDPNKKRKRKKQAEEKEEEYEKTPRLTQRESDEPEHLLLPIKSKQGLIKRVETQKKTDEPDLAEVNGEMEEGSTEELEPPEPSKPPQSVSTIELLARRQQKLTQKKLQIAQLASSVMENPHENISQLKELCALCEERDVDVQITTRKLAMVSLCMVFKDIAPGYHVRLPTEKEKEVKVSKDVKKLREFEEGLLTNYQKYLRQLEQVVQDWTKAKNHQKKNGALHKRLTSEGQALVAVQCMCDLLTSLPHFNFHTNLIAVLVPRMDEQGAQGKIAKLCCQAFHSLFREDSIREVSLEAVKLISKYVKSRGNLVHARVLETFLSLRISEMDVKAYAERKSEANAPHMQKGKHRLEKKLKGKISRKNRKKQKEMKKLEKELQETQATNNREKRGKLQTEILKFVFVTYFRVLKSTCAPGLLSPVLEGLATHAHLINVDFFSDLMAALQTLIDSKILPLKETLLCVLTAFKILSGQGEALNIDPRNFYCTLYGSLLQVHAGLSDSVVPVVLKCLDVMINKRRRQVPLQRVSAFIKRLCTEGLHVSAGGSLAFLSCARSFVQAHPRCQTLLDSESMGTGLFRPNVEDPELCNAESTTVWELSLLSKRHYHPAVQVFAGHLAEGAPSKGNGAVLGRRSPEDLLKDYGCSDMKLNPSFSDISSSTKKTNTRRQRTVNDEDFWRTSSLHLAFREAMEFTEQNNNVVFNMSNR